MASTMTTRRRRRRSALAIPALYYLIYALPTASAYHAGSNTSTKPISGISHHGSGSNSLHSKELFSVAPMMGHTNRHYRHYFRLLSRRAHLYTEMIPSSQIVAAYRRARGIYLHVGTDRRNQYKKEEINAEEMMEVMDRMKADPAKEYRYQSSQQNGANEFTLHQLIGTSYTGTEYPVVLQLGGKDPHALGMAAAVGAAYGKGEYHEINLNCGCPSNAVGGRSGGCSLMRQPELVAQCVEQMNLGVQSLYEVEAADADADDGSSMNRVPGITVKHRLGVRDASTFDAAADRAKGDEEAYDECSKFIKTVSMNGDVTKFHVHARLGLLGEFVNEDDDDEEEDESYDDDDDGQNNDASQNGNKNSNRSKKKARQSLWVPGDASSNHLPTARLGKIDHKREQIKAIKRARKATVKNRHVPPLRPHVINRLAEEFSQYEFVTNGGVQTMSEVKKVVDSGLFGGCHDDDNEHTTSTRVVGAMVGRSVINHPCSFAAADDLWDNGDDDITGSKRQRSPTRGEVLEDYIQYCDEEEERIRSYGASTATMENLRKRLVAVPFHLFVGEEGSDLYQRRLKKLRDKCRSLKASSILEGAASFVPVESLNKCINDFVDWEDIAQYDKGLQRGSAMQRVVY